MLSFARGPTLIILVVQLGEVKIYVASVDALRRKEREDETQFTTKIGGFLSFIPCWMLMYFFAGFFCISPCVCCAPIFCNYCQQLGSLATGSSLLHVPLTCYWYLAFSLPNVYLFKEMSLGQNLQFSFLDINFFATFGNNPNRASLWTPSQRIQTYVPPCFAPCPCIYIRVELGANHMG